MLPDVADDDDEDAVIAGMPFLPLLDEEEEIEELLLLLPELELAEELEVPLEPGASKLMRAPRLYWGVALNRSFSM